MSHFETIIVGNGLIGSAAARHLSALGERVAVVGQEEPANLATHEGVFASHYDERRLAHVFGRNGHWVDAKRSAITGYRELEQQSGIPFYDPVGYLLSTPAGQADDPQAPHQQAIRLKIPGQSRSNFNARGRASPATRFRPAPVRVPSRGLLLYLKYPPRRSLMVRPLS